MAIFFVGWALWEDLTFILACCIALVVCSGLVKLWWTNRTIRRLEILDEERNARVREIQHCGINALAVNDVPFGVRAIQSGIEVDGIWISRPNTPDISQIASSTTLIGGEAEFARKKAKWVDSSSEYPRRSPRRTPASSSGQHTLHIHPPTPHEAPRIALRLENDAVSHAEANFPASSVEAYVPTGSRAYRHIRGMSPEDQQFRIRTQSLGHFKRGLPLKNKENVHTETYRPTGDQSQYGEAEVYVNRITRRANRDFEVLPAGALGPRHELQTKRASDIGENGRGQENKPEPAKLRKKQPAGMDSRS